MKNCEKGSSCKNSCIESTDTCRVVLKNPKTKKIITKMANTRAKARGGFNEAQQKAFDTISSNFDKLFNSDKAKSMAKSVANTYKTMDDAKLTNGLRHKLEVDGLSYDKILDNARAESGLNGDAWRKVYNPVKNKVNGKITKLIVDAKPC